jgi:CheY-like chemotaxis protein
MVDDMYSLEAAGQESDSQRDGSHAAPDNQLRVLVVDDNQDSADSLTMLIGIWGYEACCAHNGVRALALAADFRPDAVLLDIGLPGMTGYELAQRLRQRPETKDAVLVAITGYGQDEDKQRSAAAGIHHHMVKPVNPDQLQALLASLAPARRPAR